MSIMLKCLQAVLNLLGNLDLCESSRLFSDAVMLLHCAEQGLYAIAQPLVSLPTMVPGPSYRFDVVVKCVSQQVHSNLYEILGNP